MLAPKSWVVYFDFDKTDLSEQSLATIADAAAYAATSSESLVVVEGHTDTAGPSDYNDGLAGYSAQGTIIEVRNNTNRSGQFVCYIIRTT